MSEEPCLELIAHFHSPTSGFPSCPNCSTKICESCSFIVKSDPNQKICELCHFYSIKSSGHILSRLAKTLEMLTKQDSTLSSELNSSKVLKSQGKSSYKDLESSKQARVQKTISLEKQVQDLEIEAKTFEGKIEKYKLDLVQSTTKAKMITADRDRLNMEYEECCKKIDEFREMIKEQDEENSKLKEEIEEIKTKGLTIDEKKKLSEAELKARLSKLQNKIDKVRNENQTIEQQIRIMNDEERLKSGTISVLSEKVSLICGSQLEPQEIKNNELSLQMKSQLEQTMKLYKEINDLKLKKRADKATQEHISSNPCKCIII